VDAAWIVVLLSDVVIWVLGGESNQVIWIDLLKDRGLIEHDVVVLEEGRTNVYFDVIWLRVLHNTKIALVWIISKAELF